jgi:hypothetical protein
MPGRTFASRAMTVIAILVVLIFVLGTLLEPLLLAG